VTGEEQDRLYLDLKGARERLCRAQTGMEPEDAALLQGAIARIDLVGADLPQWSRYDGGDPR
jgi:hypothetical protein